MPVQRREVDVLGGTTAYWVYGPADAETTIIAVHGFRGEHHGLEPVVIFAGLVLGSRCSAGKYRRDERRNPGASIYGHLIPL